MDVNGFRHRLFPAVPVPFGPDGRIDLESQARYVDRMATEPIGGVAIWTRHGRGMKLDQSTRIEVARAWRQGLGRGRLIVAVGSTTKERRPDLVIASAASLAVVAASEGADAILVEPPTLFRSLAESEPLILAYHAAIAGAGVPIIVTSLNEAAGGVNYSPQALAQLLARPEVIGIQIATLNNVIQHQQTVALARDFAPTKLIFSGEERFLGYSLMSGANAAITGLSSACTALQAEFLASYWRGDAARFLSMNAAVDDLARHTFISPMDAAPGRSIACLAHLGIVRSDAANDPYGPRIGPREIVQIRDCLARIGQLD